MKNRALKFTGVVVKEEKAFSSLCFELDVASCGRTASQAKRMLLEAVTLHLETAMESNLPYLRPVPPSENPILTSPDTIYEMFDFDVDLHLIARAA
jgi:predicted RNase H-like HicB family nuclease